MSIKMPKVANHRCDECGEVAEYYFNEYGSIAPCNYCNASPISLTKVSVTCSQCFDSFDPFDPRPSYVSDSAPVAFCPECWPNEAKNRGII